MSKQTSMCLIAALVSTFVIIGVGLFLAVMSSMTRADTAGISAVAGGVSDVFLLLLASVPVVMVLLFLIFRKVLGTRK